MGNFAVASGHHLTTQTAAEVLRAGGTAVDAAIAVLWWPVSQNRFWHPRCPVVS